MTFTNADDEVKILAFLRSVLPVHLLEAWASTTHPVTPPFVTATWAQSLDSKIAGKNGAQIKLSGASSMRMTHLLRKYHWGIMVGSNTLRNDNPSLTARGVSGTPLPIDQQPVPLILDSKLTAASDRKVVANYESSIGHQPILLTVNKDNPPVHGYAVARLPDEDVKGKVPIDRAIQLLLEQGTPCKSVMIEGGAAVLHDVVSKGIADLLIITIAPTLVGEGVSVLQGAMPPPQYEFFSQVTLQNDWVVAFKKKH